MSKPVNQGNNEFSPVVSHRSETTIAKSESSTTTRYFENTLVVEVTAQWWLIRTRSRHVFLFEEPVLFFFRTMSFLPRPHVIEDPCICLEAWTSERRLIDILNSVLLLRLSGTWRTSWYKMIDSFRAWKGDSLPFTYAEALHPHPQEAQVWAVVVPTLLMNTIWIPENLYIVTQCIWWIWVDTLRCNASKYFDSACLRE